MLQASHKSGFVNIFGNPNAGKSTLMNAMVGERLSIITEKAQTTRHRIIGIVNADNYQIVFSDTPGLLKPKYKMQEGMMNFVKTALDDADIIIFITDINESIESIMELLPEKVKTSTTPVLLLINKIDSTTQEWLIKRTELLKTQLPKAEIIPCSALKEFNTDYILKRIVDLLPVGDPFYEKDQLTDRSTRFFITEIVREKILMLYQEEIPYSVEVVVTDYKEGEKLDKISVEIFVNRDSQKGIIIGAGGKAIKRLGIMARKDIEKFLQKQVFIEIHVKVKKDWRENENELKRFGYFD